MKKVVADSSCDIFTLEGVSFATVPLTISTDEREFVDDETLDTHTMVEYLASYKGRSHTACPSTEAWLNAFDGADELYVVAMTSNLSGTYNSARNAAEIYKEDHPDAKIFILDTLSTGPEMHLVLEKIARMIQDGRTFEEIEEMAAEYNRNHTRLFFVLPSLHNLAQNGRVSKVIASAIGVLGISILGTASTEGTIEPVAKLRGEKKVIKEVLSTMEKAGYKGGAVHICESEGKELALKVSTAIHTKFPTAKVKIYPSRGLVSFYAEKGGILVGCETV